MFIADVLAKKGTEVVTVPPTTLIPTLVELLADRGIGAVVVIGADGSVCGVASERDVVLRLHRLGTDLMSTSVKELMTTSLHTCTQSDSVDSVLAAMTNHRIRHVPVLDHGALIGIVSIGDLVKSRIDELQVERDHLTAYISS